jgi:hypothetical protein
MLPALSLNMEGIMVPWNIGLPLNYEVFYLQKTIHFIITAMTTSNPP